MSSVIQLIAEIFSYADMGNFTIQLKGAILIYVDMLELVLGLVKCSCSRTDLYLWITVPSPVTS